MVPGQVLGSVALDVFGLLGVDRSPVTVGVAGPGLLVTGRVFVELL